MKNNIQNFNEHKENSDYYSSNPKDHKKTFETWDELFEFQARKDGANYTMLKEWLKKFCEVPKLKDELLSLTVANINLLSMLKKFLFQDKIKKNGKK
jgi:hypothetical protein